MSAFARCSPESGASLACPHTKLKTNVVCVRVFLCLCVLFVCVVCVSCVVCVLVGGEAVVVAGGKGRRRIRCPFSSGEVLAQVRQYLKSVLFVHDGNVFSQWTPEHEDKFSISLRKRHRLSKHKKQTSFSGAFHGPFTLTVTSLGEMCFLFV